MSDQELDRLPENNGKNEDTMMNMFASVWVKVEVQEYDTEPNVSSCCNQNIKREVNETPIGSEQKKKRKRRSTKTFTCDKCEYTTSWKNCLDLHLLKHNETKPFTCTICDYNTKYPTSLHRHMVIRHQKDEIGEEMRKKVPLYKCENCDYTTFYKWNLNAHKRKHKLEKQYKCGLCPYETAYRHNYMKHCKVHNEGAVFKCDKCPFVTKYEGHITRHLAKIHNEVIDKANKCDYCDFVTKIKWRLNIHKQRSRKSTQLKCSFCEFETFYTCEIKLHKISHYGQIYGSPKTVNSVEDGRIQSSEEKAIEMNLEPPINSQNKYTLDPNCVDWHNIQVIESDDKERPFSCHMCNYTSKFKASVQRHFQRHHTGSHNRPYKCCNCDFSTKTKDQIALHNKRSQSAVPLFCSICSFTTYYKCQYAMHQKCHYDYKCSVCQQPCKDKYELQKHFAMFHLGKSLKCQYCDYTAVRKDSLLCHETIHTGIKPFKCIHCTYTSVRKSLLDNHLKRYHNEIKKDVTIVTESKIQSLRTPLLDERNKIKEQD